MSNLGYTQSVLDEYSKIVDSKIDQFIKRKHEESPEFGEQLKIIREYMRGGKMVRSVSAIQAYLGVNGREEEKIIEISPSLELIHFASTAVDDGIDDSDTRHGKPTLHKRHEEVYTRATGEKHGRKRKDYGRDMESLDGHRLVAWGIQILDQCSFRPDLIVKAIEIYSKSYEKLCDGERKDVNLEEITKIRNISYEEYAEMVGLKTDLLNASIQIALTFAGASDEQKNGFSEFNRKLTELYQIRDDDIGVFGEEEKTGKPIDDDIRAAKPQLVLIETYNRADENDKKVLDEIVGNRVATREQCDIVRKIAKKTGALEEIRRREIELEKQAKEKLYEIPNLTDKCVRFFDGLTEFARIREK